MSYDSKQHSLARADILNATFFHFLAKESNVDCIVGSSRSLPLSSISNIKRKIDEQACIVDSKSEFSTKSTQRYAEAAVADQLQEDVLYLTRIVEKGAKPNITGLSRAIDNVSKGLR
jgi:hypothetical protein